MILFLFFNRAGAKVTCECGTKDTTPFILEINRQLQAGKLSNTIDINGECCKCTCEPCDGEENQICIKNKFQDDKDDCKK